MTLLRDIHLRDPYVLLVDDTYYLFGTTSTDPSLTASIGFDAYRSTSPGERSP